MSDPYTAIQVVMMPRDTNPSGTIFGGVLLSYIDQAGAISARRELSRRGGNPRAAFVTVAINRVEFKLPVMVGDVVRFQTTCEDRPHVDDHAGRRDRGTGAQDFHVTEAEGVYVAIDPSVPMADRRPIALFPA